MIKIPSNITISGIADLYSQLYATNEDNIDIELPSKMESDFSLLFSYLQFLSTWIRDSRSGNLHIPATSIDNAINYLEENDFVYPSIVLSWEKQILIKDGSNIRSYLKNPSKEYFERMDFFNLKGASVPIYCFDHDKSNRGLSKHLYKTTHELVSEDTLGYNLYKAFQKVGINSKYIVRNNIRTVYDEFIGIIHELYCNTHEHAKTNELGYNLYPNIRAIQIKFHKKTIKNFISQFKLFDGLINYFQSDFSVNEQGNLYLLEISILDSGPGLVKRYKGVSDYEYTIDEELKCVKECLYRHNTSADPIRGETKGIGLDRVLQTLDGKGFVRIKSGRLDVFRDMKNDRYFHHENSSEILLNDLKNNSPTNLTTYPATEGTLISIFYPLEQI